MLLDHGLSEGEAGAGTVVLFYRDADLVDGMLEKYRTGMSIQ